MPVTVSDFGKDAKLVTLKNEIGTTVELISFGAALKSFKLQNHHCHLIDVVLGYDNLQGYHSVKGYLGASVGRVCNRIGGGKFTLNGVEYQLAVNKPPNHCHGGVVGFSHKIWDVQVPNPSENRVVFSLVSPDGDENYPGRVECRADYRLTDDNKLKLTYSATTDKATPINLTNHAYFNLEGEGTSLIYDHQVAIYSDRFCATDPNGLVTGEIVNVSNTPYDLREPVELGKQLKQLATDGFDNHYCFEVGRTVGTEQHLARAFAPKSGVQLDIYSTQKGIQFYTANGLNQVGKGGKKYGKHSSFCLETQGFPDAVNKPQFPSVILHPGDKFEESTTYHIYVPT